MIRRTAARMACMFILSLVLFVPRLHAQQNAAAPVSAGDEDVEVLLGTMNEVLDENRRMRDEMTQREDELQKLAKENNLLRSQVRRYQRTEKKAGEVSEAKQKQMEGDLREMAQAVVQLTEENEKMAKDKKYLAGRLPEMEQEVTKLRTMLDSAVLEGEREDYLNLIESAQTMAAKSFEELKAAKRRSINMQYATADANYKLGNMLFDLKDYENAIKAYESALVGKPRDAWIHHNLGIIYDYYIHDDARAVYHYREYLKLKDHTEEANEIRERILEMELKRNMIPDDPLKKDFYDSYTKEVR